jgi:hypothetical protein
VPYFPYEIQLFAKYHAWAKQSFVGARLGGEGIGSRVTERAVSTGQDSDLSSRSYNFECSTNL